MMRIGYIPEVDRELTKMQSSRKEIVQKFYKLIKKFEYDLEKNNIPSSNICDEDIKCRINKYSGTNGIEILYLRFNDEDNNRIIPTEYNIYIVEIKFGQLKRLQETLRIKEMYN